MVKHELRSGLWMVFLAVVLAVLKLGQIPQKPERRAPARPEPLRVGEPARCAGAAPATVPYCEQLAQHILDTTVRIEMQGFNFIGPTLQAITRGGKSHATVVGGRYLVTHNHFDFDLTTLARPEEAGYTGLTLRSWDGGLLLENAPLTAFTVVHESPETLVLEFLDGAGNGLFESLGLPSAELVSWEAVPWQVGLELAQVDWDETEAHVEWVAVEAVDVDGPAPRVQVNNFARSGASGAGAFWNGYHVGNNWARNVDKDPATGEVARLYTIVALNNEKVMGLRP